MPSNIHDESEQRLGSEILIKAGSKAINDW